MYIAKIPTLVPLVHNRAKYHVKVILDLSNVNFYRVWLEEYRINQVSNHSSRGQLTGSYAAPVDEKEIRAESDNGIGYMEHPFVTIKHGQDNGSNPIHDLDSNLVRIFCESVECDDLFHIPEMELFDMVVKDTWFNER